MLSKAKAGNRNMFDALFYFCNEFWFQALADIVQGQSILHLTNEGIVVRDHIEIPVIIKCFYPYRLVGFFDIENI